MKEEISYKKFLELLGKEEIKEEKKEQKEKKKKEAKEKAKSRETKSKKKLKRKVKKKKEEKEIKEKEEKVLSVEEYTRVETEKLPEAIVELEEEKEEEFLVFRVGDEFYSIYTHQATEVVTGIDIVETSDLPDYAIGMANFRNMMIPVISFSKLLNIPQEKKPYSYIFIEKDKRENIFIRTGEVKGIYRKRDVKLLEVPYDLDKEIFKKIILINDDLVPLIDILKLIEKKE